MQPDDSVPSATHLVARQHDGPVETFDVDAETTTEEFARELAEADPEEAVALARQYWD